METEKKTDASAKNDWRFGRSHRPCQSQKPMEKFDEDPLPIFDDTDRQDAQNEKFHIASGLCDEVFEEIDLWDQRCGEIRQSYYDSSFERNGQPNRLLHDHKMQELEAFMAIIDQEPKHLEMLIEAKEAKASGSVRSAKPKRLKTLRSFSSLLLSE